MYSGARNMDTFIFFSFKKNNNFCASCYNRSIKRKATIYEMGEVTLRDDFRGI